jgi:hypothetical protein
MKGRLTVCHRRIVLSLGVAALAICLPPELEAKPSNADKARDSALLSFVAVPDNVLPEHVRLRKDARSDAILPIAQNPAIVTERRNRATTSVQVVGRNLRARMKKGTPSHRHELTFKRRAANVSTVESGATLFSLR